MKLTLKDIEEFTTAEEEDFIFDGVIDLTEYVEEHLLDNLEKAGIDIEDIDDLFQLNPDTTNYTAIMQTYLDTINALKIVPLTPNAEAHAFNPEYLKYHRNKEQHVWKTIWKNTNVSRNIC